MEGKGLQVILSLSSLSSCFCLHFLCVLLYFLSQSSFMLCFVYLFFSFVYFVFDIKIKIKKYTKTVCVLCTLVLVYHGWPLKQSFLNFVSFVA